MTNQSTSQSTKTPDAQDTVGVRLLRYHRILRLVSIEATALLAGVTVYAAVKFGTLPTKLSSILGATFLTLVLVAGIFLALSRGSIEWQADLLQRYLPVSNEPLSPSQGLNQNSPMEKANEVDGRITKNWPPCERFCRWAAFIVICVAAVMLVANVWLPVSDHTANSSMPEPHIAILPGDLIFEVSRSTIDPAYLPALGSLARSISGSQIKLVIEGHADAFGSDEQNFRLAGARAEAVRSVLIEEGIPSDRIDIVPYGESHPVSANDTVEGRTRNRRVVIKVR